MRFLFDAGLLADAAGNPLVGESDVDSFVRFSKPVMLFKADGEYAAPANFDGQLVVGVKKNGYGEAYYYGFDGTKGAKVVDGIAAANCLGVSVAKIGADVYYGTHDGMIYKNGSLLDGVNSGRERAVLSVWDDELVIGGSDGKLLRLDGVAFKDASGDELVVDTASPVRSAAAFSDDWSHEGTPLMAVGRGTGGIVLYLGDCSGKWDDARALVIASSANTNLYERTRPVAIDVNGDGLEDLVTGYADGTVDVRYASIGKAFAWEFEALPFHTLEEALDTDELALIWSTGDDQPWLAQIGESPFGDDYAVSSASTLEESVLETSVVGPRNLTFHWKKSGSAGTYSVKTNGVEAMTCNEADWDDVTLPIGSGFVKVSFAASNGAVGFLDYVSLSDDPSATDDEKALQKVKAAYDEEFVPFMQTYAGVNPETATARDYLTAMTNKTTKLGAGGVPTTLLDEFIAGTDPEDTDDILASTIAIEEGFVYVGWVPDLNADGHSRRVYKVFGKVNLSDSWTESPLTEEEITGGVYHFFLVTVDMP